MNDDTPSSPFRLDKKRALVTGAGKGIGRACAQRLAKSGANVIAVARTEADLETLASAHPGLIEPWVADVTDEKFLQRIESLERLDILVNNVGTNKPQPFTEVERETLDLILNLNVRSAFLVAQAAARVMVKQGSGSIINMGSQMGHVGAKNRAVYCMTKHAIEGLTKAMAVELAVLDIRVNSVAPTFIETPLTKPMFENPEFHQDVISRIPMGHIGQVDDVANAVLFLASPAANMVTGDSLKVDGGWTAV
ncbi:SDR family oxidoreductase [Halieaceae bacterium IMCC8485]|uniref:SDR family oxidoreductase n=1 Tax=Candidatus Seongchinamella marina TaxID=2518990 RepID=A0ABT3SSL1_9GAMM|nr:SDR family NAD(P)-dependent oxidoreductase [Candidatus Seongchinamella marina]MCX2972968.1 SDR family oxidoreductase [Candidatus Seongchinamella marina]